MCIRDRETAVSVTASLVHNNELAVSNVVGSNIDVYKRQEFDNLKEVDFEVLKIPVFVNDDRNLRMLYGNDYMKPVNTNSEHGGLILDTDKSVSYTHLNAN